MILRRIFRLLLCAVWILLPAILCGIATIPFCLLGLGLVAYEQIKCYLVNGDFVRYAFYSKWLDICDWYNFLFKAVPGNILELPNY